MTWWQKAVVELRYRKNMGMSWDEAVKATRKIVRVPARASAAANLFEQHDTFEAWFWRVAENAYKDVRDEPGSGNGPALAHFSGMPDDEPLTAAEVELLERPKRGRPKAAA